jgi:putative ABC transport system permease protein
MDLFKLIIRNVFRHRLRAFLTILGVCVAMLAFCMLRTLVGAWYVGVDASQANRLVTRNKISLLHMLPVSHGNKIRQVSGVTGVAHGIWYAGIYKEKKNFFAQIVISGTDYLDLIPEFLVPEPAKKAFRTERNACIVGRKLQKRFGWKLGDIVTLKGTFFPGNIELVVRGVYKGLYKNTDETVMFFRWDFLNEHLKATYPEAADKAGWFLIQIRDPDRAAEVSREVDRLFENSLSETLTETEKAFQLGFVAMTDAIVGAIKVISIVVIGIILLVLANTMAMTARERSAEYASFKALGFGPRFVFLLIAGESIAIAIMGGTSAAILSFPAARAFHSQISNYFPAFDVSIPTLATMLTISLVVGLLAAMLPAIRISRTSIAHGLRHIG